MSAQAPRKKKPLYRRSVFGLSLVHWLVITFSLVLTLSASFFAQSQVNEKIEFQFNNEAGRVTELLVERMRKYEDALRSGVAALNSQSYGMDALLWQKFATTMQIDERYPGINGIGVIYNLKTPAALAEFVNEQRRMRSYFAVHPKHGQNEYWPITYIEPEVSNKKAVGLDIAFEESRRSAAIKARDLGLPQITAPITLVQDEKQTPGFLFYMPRYADGLTPDTVEKRNKTFLDLVYAPFIMENLMQGLLDSKKRHITLKLSDVGGHKPSILFNEHDPQNQVRNYDATPRFKKSVAINMYGREWQFEIQSGKSFDKQIHNSGPFFIFIGGIIIEFLLIILFFNLARRGAEARQQVREAQSFQSLILNNNPDAIFVKDKDFKIVQANAVFKSFYPKKQQDKIIGYTTIENYPKAEANAFLVNDKIAFRTGQSEVTERITFPDGEVRVLNTLKVRFFNLKGEPFILGVSRDVSEREQMVDQLTDSNTELERFAYVASHDLQEPLRMISNFSNALLEDCVEKLNDEERQYFNYILEGTWRMESLVQDLLTYSKINSGTEEPITFSAEDEFNKVLLNLTERIKSTNGIIRHDKLPEIEGQPIRFGRVLENLILNGLKYQPKDNPDHIPIIHVSVQKRDEDYLFSVADNGLGIEAAYLKKIFEPFQRLEHRSKASGTGIGLTISKRIVEKWGGELTVKSAAGKGSTFYFTVTR